MNDKDFAYSIGLTHNRENLVASSLARYLNCSLKYNEDPDKLFYWDYILYSVDEGWAAKCEQQEDFYTTSLDGTLCLELYINNRNKKKKKQGKLLYSKAKKLIIILTKAKKVLIFSFKTIKDLILRMESAGTLEIHNGVDDPTWKERHDTLPTACAIVSIQECILHDPSSRVYTFSDLNLPDFYEKQFNPKNHD
jgi:hypothetical protein